MTDFCMNEAMSLKPLRWDLIVVMASRRIKSMTELRRRLHAIGYEISAGQLGRLAYAELPGRLNIELLRALMTVLDCRLSDLLVEGEE
ncbi:XRE family transcriptional regulator [Ralstonia pickettii]|nr:XRE family transcriptional regulator [Ralstonia pickettii]MBA9958931.1 XRE family transcriptional regulator [Ralstonia pickettii]MBB0030625.1 XRE family transcriptional regulator [Ralstonia pickettii]MBB0040964.1 XRE family transcriptional regulator [Ralstonia pickettii]